MFPVRIVTQTTPVPSVAWRWESETDILSGAVERGPEGRTGTVELSDADGAVAVLDLVDNEVRGLDIVVWPDVITVPGLMTPGATVTGRVLLPDEGPVAEASALQVEAALSVAVDPAEAVFHLRVGPRRPVTVVRVADHLAIEVDATDHLAGFWLTGVPPFPDAL